MSFVYPLIIQQLYDKLLPYVANDPNAAPVQDLALSKSALMDTLLAGQLVFILMAFFVSIFISHRIAGPIYKITLFLRKAKNGPLTERVFFREKDNFKELATLFNEMMDGMRARDTAATLLIDEAMRANEPQQARQALEKAKKILKPN